MATATIPTRRGLPVLGNIPDMRRDRLGFLLDLSRSGGDICAFRIASRTIYLVSSTELAQTVLVDEAASFEKTERMRANLGFLLGNGLLTALNEPHRRQRRLVAPAFQHRRIGAYADVMADYAERTQAEWRDGQALDVAQEMMRLTLWVVGKTLFDADVRGEAGELGAALSTALRFANDRFTSVFAPPLSWPTPGNRRARSRVRASW